MDFKCGDFPVIHIRRIRPNIKTANIGRLPIAHSNNVFSADPRTGRYAEDCAMVDSVTGTAAAGACGLASEWAAEVVDIERGVTD